MNDPLAFINEHFHLDLVQTVKGDEFKGWAYDPDDGGRSKLYLDKKTCLELAQAFIEASYMLKPQE